MMFSHIITQFNSGCPLRDHAPDPIHPEIDKVNIDASLIRGMIKSTSGDNKDGAIKEGEEFLPLTQSTQLIESLDKSAPTPAAVTASDTEQDWLDYIDDVTADVFLDILSDDDEVGNA